MSFSLPHSSIRLRLLMARPRARVGDGQRLQRSEGCPLPAKSRVARRMAAYGGTVHSRSALGKNRHRQDMAGNSLMPLGYSLKGCHRPSADLQHSPKLPHAELRIFAFRFYEAAVRGLTRSANCCRSFLRQSCHSSDRFSLELATRPTRTTRPKLPVALAGMNNRYCDSCRR